MMGVGEVMVKEVKNPGNFFSIPPILVRGKFSFKFKFFDILDSFEWEVMGEMVKGHDITEGNPGGSWDIGQILLGKLRGKGGIKGEGYIFGRGRDGVNEEHIWVDEGNGCGDEVKG
jgi:hypothetical protein